MTRPTRREENKLYSQGYRAIAGVDEVGRGAWAGPIVAAAVILYPDDSFPGMRESKQLSAAVRERWYDIILSKARAYQVCLIQSGEIDRLGIGPSNREVLRQAVIQLPLKAEAAIIDTMSLSIPHCTVVSVTRGDSKIVSVAAASIIAKVTRDRYMNKIHQQDDRFGFSQHKGYGTTYHRQQLQRHGISSFHRRSFAPMRLMAA